MKRDMQQDMLKMQQDMMKMQAESMRGFMEMLRPQLAAVITTPPEPPAAPTTAAPTATPIPAINVEGAGASASGAVGGSPPAPPPASQPTLPATPAKPSTAPTGADTRPLGTPGDDPAALAVPASEDEDAEFQSANGDTKERGDRSRSRERREALEGVTPAGKKSKKESGATPSPHNLFGKPPPETPPPPGRIRANRGGSAGPSKARGTAVRSLAQGFEKNKTPTTVEDDM